MRIEFDKAGDVDVRDREDFRGSHVDGADGPFPAFYIKTLEEALVLVFIVLSGEELRMSMSKMCGFGALFHLKNSPGRSNGDQNLQSFSNSALGADWLQRQSSSSWENLSTSDSSDGTGYDFFDNPNQQQEQRQDLAPPDVPEGSIALYVGSSEENRQRFVVDTCHLNNPLFKPLLDKAAEEYGYDQAGALSIPCDARLFKQVLWLLENNDSAAAHLEISQLLR